MGIGVALGIPAALAGGRLVQNSLYGLEVFDPFALAVSILVIVVAALLAGYLPARRALKVDTLLALRYE